MSMAQMSKGTADPDIASKAQKAFDEAVEAAGNSCNHLNGLQMRLEFLSMDLEAGSFLANKKTSREEAGGGQARGQGRSEPGRSQCKPDARNGLAWDQDRGAGEDPGRIYFFLRLGQGEGEQLGQGGPGEVVTLVSLDFSEDGDK